MNDRIDHVVADGSRVRNTTRNHVSKLQRTQTLGRVLGRLSMLMVAANLSGPVAFADTLSFRPQQAFDSGGGPSDVGAADINGDGKLDLIVANSNGHSVSVLLNTGVLASMIITFDTRVPFDTGDSPTSLATGDLNGDGRPDLIVANSVDSSVSVLLNTTEPGSPVPSFAPQEAFETGSYPFAITAADVNGDGRVDIIVANYMDNTLSVLVNLTAPGAVTPRLAAQKVFSTGENPFSVTTADVNADGLPDLVTANLYGDSVSVLVNSSRLGTMELGFRLQQSFPSGVGSDHVAEADFNDDGLPDLVVANYNDHTVSVLLNATLPGADLPAFAPRQVLAAGHHPYAVIAADVSLDGSPDIIVANDIESTLSVLVNRTSAGATAVDFAEQERFGTGSFPAAVIAADVNGDGDLDLVSANYGGGTASVLLNAAGLKDYVFADGFE